MINGTHILLFSERPDDDRAFFRDVLSLASVDAGRGRLIFALPPAELAVHPWEDGVPQEEAGQNSLPASLCLMCDDIDAEIESLRAKNVACTPVATAPWGRRSL